ncbi:MAG: RNA-directed DNA polymerase [candidate division NC10 bacterium]|nr:RNA-directed DNA polymerase [candidate division NC10 bacterium]MDE2321548.1 RNA-directed DNA polymerase [candidate division NC10 bacterium]
MTEKTECLGICSLRYLEFQLGVNRDLLREVAAKAGSYYRPFPKHKGGKIRWIDNPIDPLKHVQRRINRWLLSDLKLPIHIHGGVRGCSPFTNASIHTQTACVVTLDIGKCFPSITNDQVFYVWNSLLGCSPTISRLLTQLTTFEDHLPQGAPTSTTLANLVLMPPDINACAVAEREGLRITRFVDDIAFSGVESRSVINPVVEILHHAGFRVPHRKVKVMPNWKPQVITGLLVNNKRIVVPRKNRSQVRAAIHQLKYLPAESSRRTKSITSILGRITHIEAIKKGPENGLRNYFDRITS